MASPVAAGDLPDGPLRRIAALCERRHDLEREEAELVRRARAQGYAWQHIAHALGVTRQAVHKKYGRR